MKHLPSSFLRFAGLLIVTLAGCVAPQPTNDAALPAIASAQPIAPAPTVTVVNAPTAQTFASVLTAPTPVALAEPLTPFPSPSLVTNTAAWPRISFPGGGAFAYPSNSEIRFRINMNYPDHGFSLDIHSLPPEQESELYHKAGDSWTYAESPRFQVPWAQERYINGLDWHLYISGYTEGGYTIGQADFDRLWEKGALINASLNAVHYERNTQLAVVLGTSLTPDQLVLLDAKGGDGIFPEQFATFIDILNSISLGANQNTQALSAQPTSDDPTITADAVPSVQPFVSPLPSPPESAAWPILLLPGGGSFAYPPDADVNLWVSMINSELPVGASPWVQDISINVYSLPSDQEPELYRQAGDKWISEGGDLEYHVPWAQTLRVNGIDWRLQIIGYDRLGNTETSDRSAALDYASLSAVHYDKTTQRVVSLSASLTLDQLALLETEGGDSLYPAQFKVFSDILNTITLSSNSWPIYSLPQGVSFTYPPEWQVDIGYSDQRDEGIWTDANVVPAQGPRYLGLGIHVYPLPADQEATLYHQAGDTWTYRESPVFHVPWAQELRIGDLDWHMYLQGYSEGGLFVRRPDLDYLFEKGALTSASLNAVYYDRNKQLVINLSQGLTPDQLAMLDAQGMDAMYPEQFKVFSEILNTIAISP